MKKIFILLITIYTISILTETHPVEYTKLEEKLTELFSRISQVEAQLNRSVNILSAKIDSGKDEIINLIKKHSSMNSNDKDLSDEKSRPVNALLIIDVQNDFISGSLALRNCPSKHNGEEVVPVINELLNTIDFDVVVYSLDWHPENHISFFDNLHLRSKYLTDDSTPESELQMGSTATFEIPGYPRFQQTLWPRHCVQDSEGAKLHSDLKLLDESIDTNASIIHIYKGSKPDVDSYSAFWDNAKLSETSLHEQLQKKHVTQVFVTGLATDWCVYSTAVHALEHGYKTFIIEDACRGVDEKTIKERMAHFVSINGHLIQSSEVKDYSH